MTFDIKDIKEGILNGDRVNLARAITLIESSNKEHFEDAEKLLELCLPHSGNSLRIGITGIPGVGKSTFIEAFGNYIIENTGKKVAVLAVDPSSTSSKGSILGDKTRMNVLSNNENAFIRPSPTSGSLGGVANTTRNSIILCEAAGYEIILVETVGVGQSETEVSQMVDLFTLLMMAGTGDELQGMKRGIMEMADILIIHKADSDKIKAARKARAEYKNALHLFPAKASGWNPQVEMCSSTENSGHSEVWEQMESYYKLVKENGFFEKNRRQQAVSWMKSTIQKELMREFYNRSDLQNDFEKMSSDVENGIISPGKAARAMIELFKNQSS